MYTTKYTAKYTAKHTTKYTTKYTTTFENEFKKQKENCREIGEKECHSIDSNGLLPLQMTYNFLCESKIIIKQKLKRREKETQK